MKLLMTSEQRYVLRAVMECLGKRLDRQNLSIIVESFTTCDWSSLTFAGSRHKVDVRLGVAADAQLAEDLAALDFAIPGHIVASVALLTTEPSDGGTATIEVLTIASPAFRFDVASTSSTSAV